MRCLRCGARLPKTCTFCPRCGTRFSANDVDAQNSCLVKKHKVSSFMMTFGAVIAFVPLVIAMMALFFSIAGNSISGVKDYLIILGLLIIAVAILLLSARFYLKHHPQNIKGVLCRIIPVVLCALLIGVIGLVVPTENTTPLNNGEGTQKVEESTVNHPDTMDNTQNKFNWHISSDATDTYVKVDDSTEAGAYSCFYRFNDDGSIKSVYRLCNHGFYAQLQKTPASFYAWCESQNDFTFTMYDNGGNSTAAKETMVSAELLGYSDELAVRFFYDNGNLVYESYDYHEDGGLLCIYHYGAGGTMTHIEYNGGTSILNNEALLGDAVSTDSGNEVLIDGKRVVLSINENGVPSNVDVYENGNVVKSVNYEYNSDNRIIKAQAFDENGLLLATRECDYTPGSKSYQETWMDADGKSYYFVTILGYLQ